jgi:hypothetical protein
MEDSAQLMKRGLAANIAARGWLETNYYQLGSDYRQSGNSNDLLSYMTQMGGAPILDYALNYAPGDGTPLARLGYASYLASWALVNSSTPETDYGYWYKGKKSDGAASWHFNPQKYTRSDVFANQGQPRGGLPIDGEIDNGFSDALLGASTVVIADPVFGLIALGGEVSRADGAMRIALHDGVEERLIVRTARSKLDISLDRDGFDTSSEPVIIHDSGGIDFILESRYRQSHVTTLTVQGAFEGRYEITSEGSSQEVVVAAPSRKLVVPLSVHGVRSRVIVRRLDDSKS